MKNDIRMISGCEDVQTSADVSNVNSFQLPDPAGRAGGACTSTLLNILYADETVPEDDLSFTQVLEKMRINLQKKGFEQIPQLTSSNPIDVDTDFDLVPATATGARRAVMIGINYVGHDPGELRGCHNDVLNMVGQRTWKMEWGGFLPRKASFSYSLFLSFPQKKYIQNVHGFAEEDIQVLMDDGEHTSPTKANIIAAYKKIIAETKAGDAVFLHYSGHGTKLRVSWARWWIVAE